MKKYSRQQLEDKALKSAGLYFGRELLPYFGIRKTIRRLLPTEQVRLEAVRATEDMLFEMEDDTLSHFEFESVEVTEDDLRRYRSYDAYTGMVYKKQVHTYVVCSGKVGRIKSVLYDDLNPYKVIPLRLKTEDADALLKDLRQKAERNSKLTKAELTPLLLVPLMSGETSIKDRIIQAERLVSYEGAQINKEEKRQMEAVLYALACKFLEKQDFDEVKEEFSVTILGELIWNDGVVKGEVKGRKLNLIEMICRKLKKGKLASQIAEELDEDLEETERICAAAGQCAPEYNSERIYQILTAK